MSPTLDAVIRCTCWRRSPFRRWTSTFQKMELHLLEGGVSGFGFKCSSQRWATLRSWRSGFSDIREWLPYNGNGKEQVKKIRMMTQCSRLMPICHLQRINVRRSILAREETLCDSATGHMGYEGSSLPWSHSDCVIRFKSLKQLSTCRGKAACNDPPQIPYCALNHLQNKIFLLRKLSIKRTMFELVAPLRNVGL